MRVGAPWALGSFGGKGMFVGAGEGRAAGVVDVGVVDWVAAGAVVNVVVVVCGGWREDGIVDCMVFQLRRQNKSAKGMGRTM
jgi:hypothetical protein